MKTQNAVHYATFVMVDSGETTLLYLHSHEEIDAEINQRIRQWPDQRAEHEATRVRFHIALDTA